MLFPLLLIVASACFSLALTPCVRLLSYQIGAVDKPGERKIHVTPTPRLGGLSVVSAGVLTVLVVLGFERIVGGATAFNLADAFPMMLGGAVILLTGIWDDIRPIPAWLKFLFQAIAAAVTIRLGIQIEHISLFGSSAFDLGLLSVPVTGLWIIGITNAFNLVDGLDGLAAGLAIITASSSAAIYFLLGSPHEAQFLLILIGALLGFLPYNFNPAKIFLGDSGSMVIGYLLAVTAIGGTQKASTSLAVVTPLLIFGLPIADTLLSMTRRFLGNLKLFQLHKAPLKAQLLKARCMFKPDQSHIHHRLLSLGFSHRNAVLLLYATALGLSTLALLSVLAQYRNVGAVLLTSGLATYIGVRKLGYDELSFLRTGTLLRWYDQLTFDRRFFLGFLDLIFISAAYGGALLLKYDAPRVSEPMVWYLNVFPFVLISQLGVFYLSGLYKGVWRATGVGDLVRIASAVPPAVALPYILVLLSVPPKGVLGFFGIDALLLGALLLGARSTYRVLDYLKLKKISSNSGGEAIIYGAGRGGQLVLRELQQNAQLGLHPIGFLDDNPALHGRTVNRIPVMGSIEDLKAVVDSQPISTMIISSPQITGYRLHRALSLAHQQGISVLQGNVTLVPLETNGMSRTRIAAQSETPY